MRISVKARLAAELSAIWDLHTKIDARLGALCDAGRITAGAAYLVHNSSNNYGLKRYIEVGYRCTPAYNRTTTRQMAVLVEMATETYERALAFVEEAEFDAKYPELDEIDWDNITMKDVADALENACQKVGVSASDLIKTENVSMRNWVDLPNGTSLPVLNAWLLTEFKGTVPFRIIAKCADQDGNDFAVYEVGKSGNLYASSTEG